MNESMKLQKLYENWRLIIIIFIKINKYYNNNNTIHRAALIWGPSFVRR